VGPTTVSVNPACGFCEQIDLDGGYGIAGYGGDCLKNCGDTCQSDSDCKNPSAAGIPVICNPTTKICENSQCPAGQTVPGANCTCNAGRSCGQTCGASVGLCGDGISECGFITTSNQCLANEGNTAYQFCLPTASFLAIANNNYTVGACSGIQAKYLINQSGQSGSPPLTQQNVMEACQTVTPTATATATSAPTGTSSSISAQCLNIKIYDSEWQNLTVSQLAQKKAGDIVRFAVAGSTTGGTFAKARFTINNLLQAEVNQKKPDTEEFYDEYTIPQVAGLTVKAEIYHSILGWF
jgi:hypothetical protein